MSAIFCWSDHMTYLCHRLQQVRAAYEPHFSCGWTSSMCMHVYCWIRQCMRSLDIQGRPKKLQPLMEHFQFTISTQSFKINRFHQNVLRELKNIQWRCFFGPPYGSTTNEPRLMDTECAEVEQTHNKSNNNNNDNNNNMYMISNSANCFTSTWLCKFKMQD